MAGTVLVVEDEAQLAGLLRDVLSEAGYEVVLATGSQAAARVREVTPVAVVMDYLMPGLNGVEVAAQIRRTVPGPLPPLLLVTGLRNAQELAQEMQAAAYLRKPFDVDVFVRIIGELAASRR